MTFNPTHEFVFFSREVITRHVKNKGDFYTIENIFGCDQPESEITGKSGKIKNLTQGFNKSYFSELLMIRIQM